MMGRLLRGTSFFTMSARKRMISVVLTASVNTVGHEPGTAFIAAKSTIVTTTYVAI